MEIKRALVSGDKKNRYWLIREWDPDKPKIMFVGLNPSIADGEKDDNTIRKVRKLAKSWGFGAVYMLNLFSQISTDPKGLDVSETDFELDNFYLNLCRSRCAKVVFAWGSFKVNGRDQQLKEMFPSAFALHINSNGSPKHPLYVKNDSQLIPFAV